MTTAGKYFKRENVNLEGTQITISLKPDYQILDKDYVEGIFTNSDGEYVYVTAKGIRMAISCDMIESARIYADSSDDTFVVSFDEDDSCGFESLIDQIFMNVQDLYNLEDEGEDDDYTYCEEALDRMDDNIDKYEEVLLTDNDDHTDSLFLFIKIKLAGLLDRKSSECISKYIDCDDEIERIGTAYNIASDIVEGLEEGIQPSDADVALLMTLLADAHKWWN